MFAFGCSRLGVRIWMFTFGCSRLDVRVWMFAFLGSHLDVRLSGPAAGHSANLTILSLTRHHDGNEPFVVTTSTGVRILVELAES